ncbi:MAG: O-antigen ligase family protein, partial [Polyangiaceae bacterium]
MRAVERSPTWPTWTLAAVAVAIAALAFDPMAASAATPKIALAVVVALVVLAPSLPHLFRHRIAPPSGLVPWLALAGWSLLSLAWSPRPDPSIVALWLAAGGIAVATSALEDRAQRRLLTGRVATLVTAGASLVVLAQWATGAEGIACHGAMGNPNWLGLTLACALPLVVGHASHRGGRERIAAIATVALGVAGLVLAESRVAFVALAIVGAAAVVRRSNARRRRALVLAAIVAVPLAVVAARAWAEPLAGRLWLASVSFDAWRDAPFVGHGSGAFTSAYLAAQAAPLADLPIDEAARRYLFATTAHGDWVQLAVEGGLVAFALGVLPFALAITTAPAASASAVAVVALCMLGDAPLRQPAVVLLLALALADTPPLAHRDRRDALSFLAVTVVLTCLLPRATTQWHAERAAHAAHDAVPAERLATLERARRMAPWWGAPAFDAGLTLLDLGEPERALAAFDEAARAGMVGPSSYIARGNALVGAGHPAEAVASYQAALHLHPASFRAHANLSEAARLSGDLGMAARHLALARDLQPHHPKL